MVFKRAGVIALLVAASLPLAGCGALNTGLSSMVADSLPAWAGGLPKDAPPRPGDPRFEEYEREQQAKSMIGTQGGAPATKPAVTPAVQQQAAPNATSTASSDGEAPNFRPQGRGLY